MKVGHIVKSLLSILMLILGLALTGCAGMTTTGIPELTCTRADISGMLQSGDYQKKADNFLIIQDATPSMGEKAEMTSTPGPSKLSLSQGLIICLNNTLPEDINVNGGLRVSGPLESEKGRIYGMEKFSNTGLENTIRTLGVTGDKTNIIDGINDGSDDLNGISGRTAVILFSDGKTVKDANPQAAAAAMKEQYGERVCIYTVLMGNDPDGSMTMQQIASEGRCGFATTANNLYMRPLTECDTVNVGKGMGDFVASVFLEKAPPKAIPMADLDSDGDGVPDSRDKCSNTPKGIKVDSNGCPIPLLEKISVTLIIEFDYDKADVKPIYHKDIEKVANILQAYPEKDMELEGHTDNIGSDAYNEKLSKQRAESVKNYLVQKFGINASRISTVGYGESMPVATNDTEKGRQKNRRVNGNIETVIKK
jgi:OOP family OmpA-OmpF porin